MTHLELFLISVGTIFAVVLGSVGSSTLYWWLSPTHVRTFHFRRWLLYCIPFAGGCLLYFYLALHIPRHEALLLTVCVLVADTFGDWLSLRIINRFKNPVRAL